MADSQRPSGQLDADSPAATGSVVLVGGGPGDPDLITVGGLRALEEADVVLYDRLAPLPCLARTKPGAVLIDVGKTPGGPTTTQHDINTLLIQHARRGATVVRLKGGDSFVFGRGSEEWLACAEAGIPVRVIPGVSSAIAAPALAGIPVTHRGLTQGFTVVSGHVGPQPGVSTVDWDVLARSSDTVVILMGLHHLDEICRELIDRGRAPDTPAAVIERAGWPEQRIVRGPVSEIADLVAAAGLATPAVTVIGAVVDVDLHEALSRGHVGAS